MYTLLDYEYLLPEFMNITDGKVTDNNATFDIESSVKYRCRRPWFLRLLSAEPMGQQQCILFSATQGQY